MLWYYAKEVCYSSIFVMVLCFLFAGYAYRANARRPADDPEKKDFHIGAIILAPITWPLLLVALIVIVILRAVVYSVSLFVILFALVLVRKSPLLLWLDKIATKIGNKLLAANTALIKGFLGQPIGSLR